MDFVLLISQLLNVLRTIKPDLGGDNTLIATAVGNIIAYIQQQNGLTTKQILDRAGAQLDANEIELLADLARLQGGGSGGTGGTGGTGGSAGSGGSTGTGGTGGTGSSGGTGGGGQ